MQIQILKGTNSIGGAVTEIRTDKCSCIIDFGDDLDDIKRLPEIQGLTTRQAFIRFCSN